MGIISHLLRIYPITAGSIFCTHNLVALKREPYEPFLIVKRTEWRKLIGYFGLIIEANPSRVGKKNIYIFHIEYITRTSSVKLHTPRHHIKKYFNLLLQNLCLYQLTKNIAAEIVPHLSYVQYTV